MATIEIPDEVYTRLAEYARRNQRTVEEQFLAELDVVEDYRRRRREALDAIRRLPPIDSSLDPAELIREDRDR